jgi:AcrR family transcriptional regulator
MEVTSRVKRDPEGSKKRILQAAIAEFSEHSFGGARVDQIAARAATNERMLYYYYGGKEALFRTVIQSVCADVACLADILNVAHLTPEQAIREFAQGVWAYFNDHPWVVRLFNHENNHSSQQTKQHLVLRETFQALIRPLKFVLDRGVELGQFRDNVNPEHLYLTIAAFGHYIVSNQHNLSAMMGRNVMAHTEYEDLVGFQLEILMSYLVPAKKKEL